MSAQELSIIVKAWAQQNHLIGEEFPVSLDCTNEERDQRFDSLSITASAEQVLRKRNISCIGFNEDANSIYIFTKKSITAAELKSLPIRLQDNVKVEYIHGGIAFANNPVPPSAPSAYVVSNTGRYTCGSSIHPAKVLGAGTMGCLVKGASNEIYGLSNNHVSGMNNFANIGEKILAPGHLDIYPRHPLDPFTIGYHSKTANFVQGVPDNVNVSNNLDAAIFKIADPDRVSSSQGGIYDTPSIVSQLTCGLNVEKIGRSTGHTHGFVIAQATGAFPVGYSSIYGGNSQAYFDPVFIVKSQTSNFSEPGDSGSLVTAVVNGQREAVGLLFAGDTMGNSYILPLSTILTNLGVTLLSGHNP